MANSVRCPFVFFLIKSFERIFLMSGIYIICGSSSGTGGKNRSGNHNNSIANCSGIGSHE